jgi:hypothetical protein
MRHLGEYNFNKPCYSSSIGAYTPHFKNLSNEDYSFLIGLDNSTTSFPSMVTSSRYLREYFLINRFIFNEKLLKNL